MLGGWIRTTISTVTGLVPIRRLALLLLGAASTWLVGAGSAAYVILRHGEPIGAVVMDIGAQMRNAAAPPDVVVNDAQRQEELELDRRIAAGFDEWREAREQTNKPVQRTAPAGSKKKKR